MQRRADGRRLAYRGVAEILLADFHRGEQQRNGRTGEQMVDGQLGGNADAAMAQPGVDGAATLVEGDSLAGLIAEGRDGNRVQLSLGDGFGDAVHR
ncbi:hypothetical protein D3C73_1377680 [compost metagenome]